MHFAIAFWGILRSLHHTITSIEEYCIKPISLAGHTYEIFIHTYSFAGSYHNSRNNEEDIQLNFSEWKMLRPDYIIIDDQDEFDKNINYSQYERMGDPWRNNYNSFINHIRALNSLNTLSNMIESRINNLSPNNRIDYSNNNSHSNLRSLQHNNNGKIALEQENSHFDGIIFLRPDLTYLNELPYYLLQFMPNTLFVADFHRSCRGGEYNDRMAMGDVRSALIYGHKFQAALEYSYSKPLHSEKFTHDYLLSRGVKVKEIPFRFKRTRSNGEFHDRDRDAIPAPGMEPPQSSTYDTSLLLRTIYSLLEFITYNKVYIWNHDDDENLYCTPHPKVTLQECKRYKRIAQSNRYPAPKHVTNDYSTKGMPNTNSVAITTPPTLAITILMVITVVVVLAYWGKVLSRRRSLPFT